MKNQLVGTVTKVHTKCIMFVNWKNGEIPKDKKDKPLWKAKFVVPLNSSSSDDKSSDQEAVLAKVVKKNSK